MYIHFYSFYLITGIDILTVTIKGKTKDAQFSNGFPGIYVRGPNSINGKFHWLQEFGSNAIWCITAAGRSAWCIGPQDHIAPDGAICDLPPSFITRESVDSPSPQDATTWLYFDGNNPIPSHDILVAPGTYIFNIKKNQEKYQINSSLILIFLCL